MWKAFAILSGVGIYLAVFMLICIYVGGLVDEFFALGGKGRLIGIVIGLPMAFYSIYRQLKGNGFI